MIIVESDIENYVDDLIALIRDVNTTHALAGMMGIGYLHENNLFPENLMIHIPFFDDCLASTSLLGDFKPLSSWTVLLFNGPIIVGQIYLTNVSN